MISAVLIDDESLARETLKAMLHELCPSIKVIGEAEGVQSGVRLILEKVPDAVFLDVRMNDGTGFDLLTEFPKPDFDVIFTTAYDQFAVAAFENQALHYLVKPIHPDKLVEAVGRLEKKTARDVLTSQYRFFLEEIQNQELKHITLRTNEEIIVLNVDEIVRLEASNNCTFFYPKDGHRVMITRTMKKFEKLLPAHQFFRTHQSHLVNRAFVHKVSREKRGFYGLTRDGAKFLISRKKYASFVSWLARENTNP